jgi:NAD(P)-dependent dehydrogenase (short-subunit alcohol dehydrogenase family)
MNGKVCVITGANSGVGFEAASSMAALGARVVLVCRSRARGKAAIEAIRASTPSAELRLQVVDLSSFAQVRGLAKDLTEDFPTIDVLVNNAGVYRARLEHTEDGFERTMTVNHLSHFLLTHLLLRRLLSSDWGRIVNVASRAHRRGRLTVDNLEGVLRGRGRYDGWKAYSDSKLANILFSRELANRFETSELSTCSMHPGVLATGLWSQNTNTVSLLMRLVQPLLGRASIGGDAVTFLAQEPAEAVHGKYFDKTRAVEPRPMGRDDGLARRLWELSLAAVGLPAEGVGPAPGEDPTASAGTARGV